MLKIRYKNFNNDRFQHKYKMFFTVYNLIIIFNCLRIVIAEVDNVR